jgi:predicted enzyme related to lactoylglutathione lyase
MASSALRNITIDSRDPFAQATWWAQVTGGTVGDDDFAGDPEARVEPAPGVGGPNLLFEQVPETKTVKNRVHVDLTPDTTRDEEVARLEGLGATVVDRSHVRPDGAGWVVMADPEGNEFCVERSLAERG